jgi:hypothetical protein
MFDGFKHNIFKMYQRNGMNITKILIYSQDRVINKYNKGILKCLLLCIFSINE